MNFFVDYMQQLVDVKVEYLWLMDKLPKICFNCPLSISNKNPYCKTIGNKATDKLIVLPNLQKEIKKYL